MMKLEYAILTAIWTDEDKGKSSGTEQ